MFDTLKEKIVEICAVIIACCAFFLAVYQANQSDYHNRLSVMPVIAYEVLLLSDFSNLTFQVTNKGLGPASITNMEYIKDEVAIEEIDSEKIFDYFYNLEKSLFTETTMFFVKVHGSNIIMPGKTFNLINIPLKDKSESDIKKLLEVMNNIKIGMCYRSMYGDLFYLRTYDSFPPKNSCNYNDAYWIFGSPYRLKSLWTKSISHKDIWG